MVITPLSGATMVVSSTADSAVATATLAVSTWDCSESRSACLVGASFIELAVWVVRSESCAFANEACAEAAACLSFKRPGCLLSQGVSKGVLRLRN